MMSDQFLSCVPTSIRVEQMRLIRNLIEVKISESQLSKANLTDGITIQVRSGKPFIVNAFWLVKIKDIHHEIEKSWQTMRDELWDNKFLSDNQKCLFQNKPDIYQESNVQVECNIKPPKPIDLTKFVTTTPRDFYPLVIIITCHEEEADPQATDAAASIHIVHIKDDQVPIKSHVIKQYMKQIDGRILDISQLYAEETAACLICFDEANQEEGKQLFCLLPCKHGPICSSCLFVNRVQDCPICRSPIASVFDINSPAAMGQQNPTTTPVQDLIDPNLRHLYDDNDADNQTNRRPRGFMASLRSMFGL